MQSNGMGSSQNLQTNSALLSAIRALDAERHPLWIWEQVMAEKGKADKKAEQVGK